MFAEFTIQCDTKKWGDIYDFVEKLDEVFLITTFCFLPLRQSLIYSSNTPFMSICFYLKLSPLCQTLSNALETPKKNYTRILVNVKSLTNMMAYVYKLESCRMILICVEVLRPSQPNWVMSSAVSLPNHTFTGQA